MIVVLENLAIYTSGNSQSHSRLSLLCHYINYVLCNLIEYVVVLIQVQAIFGELLIYVVV